jgi:hypothetical protein
MLTLRTLGVCFLAYGIPRIIAGILPGEILSLAPLPLLMFWGGMAYQAWLARQEVQ